MAEAKGEPSLAVPASPAIPASPLGEALYALDAFTGEERDSFFSSLDQLPSFDSPVAPTASVPEADRFEIEDEDWKWLATQVGSRTQQELVHFAHNEYERMTLEDPDLVRAKTHFFWPTVLLHTAPADLHWPRARASLGRPS